MAKSKDRDFFVNARRVVEQAIGEHMDGSPLDDPKESPRTIAGRSGGLKGGKARAKTLTEAKRKEIAKKAALKRWAKPNPVHSPK